MKKFSIEFTRRRFMQTAAAAIASPLVIPRNVLAQNGQPGANDTVKVAIVGLGGRTNHLYPTSVKPIPEVRVVAVSDLMQPRIDAFMKRHDGFKPEQGYTDFRKMIETEKPDGLMAETSTHQRAWVSVHAMLMGCHVYIEKCMSLTVAEGRAMVNTARKYKRITQVGSQHRSFPLCIEACRQIQAGMIGKVKLIEVPNFVGPNLWEDKPGQPYLDGMNDAVWDEWTNQAPLRPFHDELYRRWENWRDFDGGGRTFGVTGWGTHSYDHINMVLGTDDSGPVSIQLDEPVSIQDSGKFDNRKPDADETGAVYYGMAKVRGPRAKMTMLYADGTKIRYVFDGDRGPGLGAVITGEKGKIELNRYKAVSNPKEIAEALIEKVPENYRDAARKNAQFDGTVIHVQNWIDGIKSGKPCSADIEIGHRTTTLCHLVNIVREVGKPGEKIAWDPVKERFPGNENANKLLSRERRKGYELPE
ncbi:MAG: Gfo/Idh/MocA family oxidoreductase [Planctomycetaceae bacterium]|jgi:predicted dehydrogenase|nr:Gfo/Idh/MocA family oxidoreductase [Planctomycetaceae bacterium]